MLDHFAHVPEIAIEEVHPAAVDGKPTAAIHASAPVAESSHQFRNVPVIEVARLLGCADSTVRVHLHRATKRLGVLLGEELDDAH